MIFGGGKLPPPELRTAASFSVMSASVRRVSAE
jgi:hypothetical protein